MSGAAHPVGLAKKAVEELNIPLEDRGFRTLSSIQVLLADLGQREVVDGVLGGRPVLMTDSGGNGSGSHLVERDMLYQRTIDEGDTGSDTDPVYSSVAAPLAKRKGNPFPNMINIGRASNCDIVLLLPSVSKIHSYFQPGAEGAWDLVDCRSRNGTFVNGAQLESGGRQRLADGDVLRFGKHLTFRFLEAQTFCGELSGS